MGFKLSVTGIDGCGKSSAISGVVAREAKNFGSIAMVGRPCYIEGTKFGKRRFLFRKVNALMDICHAAGDSLKSRFLVSGANAVNGFWHVHMDRRIQSRYDPEVTIYGRDRVLDPATYLALYYPSTMRFSIERRLAFFKRILSCDYPSNLVYLHLEPSVAIERIDARIEQNNSKPGNIQRWRHMHENIEGLTFLREEFERGLFELEKHGTKITCIDTYQYSPEEVIEQIGRLLPKQ